MTCYTRCIVATISIHINNTKLYKGFKAFCMDDVSGNESISELFVHKV